MDVLWMVLGGLLMLAGIAGSVLPILPGPPLCFVGLWLQQLRDERPFTAEFLWVWAGITAIVVALEYVIPVYGTKKFGGSRFGVWGCTIGLLAGFFFGPLGIIIGPFAGALIGEMIATDNSRVALRAAMGSFIGFLAGTLLKLIACSLMTYYLVSSFW